MGKSGDLHERECKLDAQNASQLATIREHIITDPHYVTLNDPRFQPDLMHGMELLGVPENFSIPRVRVYYDDIDLNGFRNGVEIRVEPKECTEKPYKQMVKIGSNNASADGVFDRMEYPAKLPSPQPDLSLLKNGAQKKLKDVFGVSDLADVKLLPMVMLVSQRWKIEYHPGGDPAMRIEYAHDTSRGQTFTGFSWDFFQAELEMKAGDATILPREKKRLLDRFNFLSPGTRSKPSPGFDALAAALAQPEIRKAAQKSLKPGAFKVLTL
ncbi:MAG TPA: hypothetical protein VIG74_02825 [Alphaproteobacteria bacterium]|jgi:inorganic triphosphatase YgiF